MIRTNCEVHTYQVVSPMSARINYG